MSFTRKQSEQMSSLFQSADNSDLNDMVQLFKLRRTWLSNQARRQFVRGDQVQFRNRGLVIKGTVKKINPKTVVVAVQRGGHDFETWTVAPTNLSKQPVA
jgi:hypothetical protein